MPIIIEGGSRGAGGWWARHLENAEKNERVELVEIAGLSAESVPDAFREMRAVSLGSKCENYFYQANINPRADEQLTPAQWREAIDALEKNLGLAGQPRFVVEHEKEGRTHRHIVWSRIDAARMTAIPDSLTAAIHERTSRELEIKFDLERGRSILVPDRDFERPERRARKHERFRGAQNGLDPHVIGNELKALRERSDGGQSFRAGIEGAGYVLARGDRRDFVVIDRAGDDHSLARRLGIKAAELRAFMKDVDPASLPGVTEAKTRQLARAAEIEQRKAAIGRHDDIRPEIAAGAGQRQEHGRGADAPAQAMPRATEPQRGPEPAAKPLGKTAGDIRMAWTLSRSAGQFSEALEARGITLAAVTADEARANQRARAFAKELGRYVRPLREGEIVAVDGRGYVHRLDPRTTGAERGEIDKRLAGIDAASLLCVTDAKAAMREAARAAWAEQQREKRESERPASEIETTIAAALKATMTGHEFAEALDQAGLTVTRATGADVTALDTLREQESFDRQSGIAHKARHFGTLEIGDFAAVTRSGDVFRLNPHKLDFAEIEQRLADVQPRMASVTEARAAFETSREQTAAFWAQARAENTEARVARSEARDADREIRSAAATVQHEKQEIIGTAEQAVDTGARAFGRILGGFASMVSKVFDFLADMIAPAPPPTKDQAERMERAAEERQARDAAAGEAAGQREELLDLLRFERRRRERQEDLMQGRATPQAGERGGDNRDHGYERERDRD